MHSTVVKGYASYTASSQEFSNRLRIASLKYATGSNITAVCSSTYCISVQ